MAFLSLTKRKTPKSKKLSRLSISHSKARIGLFVIMFAFIGTYLLFQSFAGTHNSSQETYLGGLINQHRRSVGVPEVIRAKCLTMAAREWAQYLGDSGQFRHSDTVGLVNKYGCGNWRGLAENIGKGGTVDSQHQAYLNSPCHRFNIESVAYNSNPDGTCTAIGGPGSAPYNFVGTAAYTNDGGVLTTVEIFGNCPNCGGEWTAPIPENYPAAATGRIQGIEFGGDHILSLEREGTGQKTFINANSDGSYSFNNLTVPGTYIVRINGASGYNASWTACAGAVGSCHDNPNASGTGTEAKVYLGGGYIDLWWKFTPTSTTGTILGRVFIDANSNGVWESNEQIVQNGANCGSYPTLSASISISGYGAAYPNKCNPSPYYEASVSQGSHTVSVTPPLGYTATNGQQTVTVNAGGQNHLWFGIKQNTTTTPSLPFSDGTGLNGYYYETFFTSPTKLSRIDGPIDFNWGTGSPSSSVRSDNFVAVWYGYIKAPYTGAYNFNLASDDGSAIWVNGTIVNNFWSLHGFYEQGAQKSVYLTAGQKYPVKVIYYENGGGAAMQLKWSGPNFGNSVIPKGYLYQLNANAGLSTSIYNNISFSGNAIVRTDQHTYFGWGEGSPAAGIANDNFSTRMTGKLTAPATGNYTFKLDSDDGSRLYIGGSLLIDYWGYHGTGSPRTATKYLTAGQPIDIRIDQFEGGVAAGLSLLWSGPGIATEHWIDPMYLSKY